MVNLKIKTFVRLNGCNIDLKFSIVITNIFKHINIEIIINIHYKCWIVLLTA